VQAVPLRLSIRAPADDPASAPVQPDEQVFEVDPRRGDTVFGRLASVEVALPFPKVSGRHARLSYAQGGYHLEDLGSSNGTWLGDRRLAAHTPVGIALGETFELGGVRIRLVGETTTASPGAAPGDTESLARRLVHTMFSANPPAESARLVVLAGADQGRELPVSASGRVARVGRGEGCDLILADVDVSREHVTVARGVGGIVLADLDSKNGVEVNGQRVAGERLLHDGDVVRLGATRLRFFDPEDRYVRQMQRPEDAPAPAAAPIAGPPAMPSARKRNPPASRLPGLVIAIALPLLALAVAGLLALVLLP
jgi:pSer/pThr/pTyr-binding forkhead associated (FHA) protein